MSTESLDSALKELPQNTSSDVKFEFICQKFYDLYQEQKENTLKSKHFEQSLQQLRIEKDQLQNERNRLVLQKDKLETLCRELQKQNKVIQEESLSRARAEDEKRREVSDHFQTSITNIQNQLCEYQIKNLELRKENQELAEKLGEFIKQHEKREEHVDKLMETRGLELKLSEAKLNKAQCLLDQEKAKSQQKILQLEEEVKALKNRLDIQITIENKLKEQIVFYKEKYQSFNKAMSESRKLFDTAKDEMEKLGKRIQRSESDAVEWRGKWEVSQRSLLELAEQHKEKVNEFNSANKKIEKLSNLCRVLQNELNELRQQQHEQQQPPKEQSHQPQLQPRPQQDELSNDSFKTNSTSSVSSLHHENESEHQETKDDDGNNNTRDNQQSIEYHDTITIGSNLVDPSSSSSDDDDESDNQDDQAYKSSNDNSIRTFTTTTITNSTTKTTHEFNSSSDTIAHCTGNMHKLKLNPVNTETATAATTTTTDIDNKSSNTEVTLNPEVQKSMKTSDEDQSQ
uniref:Alpha-taxilin n=1 Tax=Trichobilharzia regenti TaxID=157069 RepID=A0AA85IXW2_TRIRE|nr:unnamed protein product [Trichobilharzia regenti]